jgi:hypothetical protein
MIVGSTELRAMMETIKQEKHHGKKWTVEERIAFTNGAKWAAGYIIETFEDGLEKYEKDEDVDNNPFKPHRN